MYFEIKLGLKNIDDNYGVIKRTSVKAIIKYNNKLLMIETNKGDYKFPGGGIEAETIEQALCREIMEETGFEVTKIGDTIGRVRESKIDTYDDSKVFIMTSLYIECEINLNSQKELKLDKYEKELDFKPIFINIDEAIKKNSELLNNKIDLNPWVYRETQVLRKLVNNYEY